MTSKETVVSNALGSAGAGIVSRCLTHPLDTVKARLQAEGQHYYKGPFDAFRRTYLTEGVRGLYRGFSAVIVGGTPGTILYLCSYDIIKVRMAAFQNGGESQTNSGEEGFGVHFVSGLLAEAIACIVYVPVDVVKERLQVQSSNSTGPRYKGGADALRTIWSTEGVVGIYRGYAATLMSFGPFSALYFVFYERFKAWSRSFEGSETPSFPLVILSSSSAGALASFMTSPLDLAKLRLQVQRGMVASETSAVTSYSGVLDCLQHTYIRGGMQGLFRGAGARVLHFVPATTFTMTSYESMRTFFHRLVSE